MQFLAPSNIFEGVVQLNQAPTADNHAVTRAYLQANAVVGIDAGSTQYAELVDVNGQKQLKIKPLTITDVSVDTSATSLSGWVSTNYINGDEKQEGDIIILTAVSGRAQTWIHNGGANIDENDFTEIKGADVTDAEIRGSLSASNGVQYNSANGQFQANVGEIRGFFSAGTGLQYDAANGVYALNVDSDGISEGSINLYYTSSRVHNELSAGAGLAYNGAGQFSLSASSDDLSEGTTNLFFENQRVWDSLSVPTVVGPNVQMLKWNNLTGELSVELADIFAEFSAGVGLSFSGGTYSLNASTDDVAEGQALYFTTQRAQDAITVGTGLSKTGGQISLSASSDDLSEGTTNLFFENQRVYDSLGVSSDADELLAYDSTKGEYSLLMSKFRKEFAPQSLTANTWQTLNHGLGKKIVHVSCYDALGMLVQVEVQLVDANNCKVKSVINLTNAEIVCSI